MSCTLEQLLELEFYVGSASRCENCSTCVRCSTVNQGYFKPKGHQFHQQSAFAEEGSRADAGIQERSEKDSEVRCAKEKEDRRGFSAVFLG